MVRYQVKKNLSIERRKFLNMIIGEYRQINKQMNK